MMMINVFWCLLIVEGQNVISTGNCVYIGDITAFVLVIYRIAANSELRQKSLRLGLDYEIKSLAFVLTEKYYYLHHSYLETIAISRLKGSTVDYILATTWIHVL